MEKEYQAVFLVGGLGTRLRPMTESVPKPMIEIEGKPFLEYKIESLRKYGIKNFVFCVGYLGHIVEEYFGDGKRFGINIVYSYEKDELLGTAGAIKNAEPLIKENFIVANGDTFLDVDFKKLINFHESHGFPFTMTIADSNHPKTQELVQIDGKEIIKFHKRNTPEHENHLKISRHPLINGGIYIFNKKIFDYIPEKQKFSLEQEVFPKITNIMKGFSHKGYILDIADENDWKEFRKDVRDGIVLPGMRNRQKIIRSRAPVRISFGGGGTDISPYDENHKGICVSATINKYVYSTLVLREDKKIKIRSDIINMYGGFETYEQTFEDISEVEIYNENPLNLIKAVIMELKPEHGFDLYVRSDVPPHSGLGASASLCVSIIGVLNHLRKKGRLTKYDIAETAYRIENERMRIKGGRQDQYASVFGGINSYEFNGGNDVKINSVNMREDFILELEKHLLVIFSGRRINSSGEIHEREQNLSKEEDKTNQIHDLKDIAVEMEFNLRRGNLKKFGKLIFEGWEKKKKFNPEATNTYIDALVEEAISSGAIGARLMGAGGGGHILVYCESDKEHKVKEALTGRGAKSIDFSFDFDGLKIWELEE
ncbi:NTP transferase domain-containing protein [Candidatus Pacearchaeota archaeon]|nr:NTP transferase domain-containing protein [Candidatus Pacearchaeota archaeon]